jgi:hypothetical protein
MGCDHGGYDVEDWNRTKGWAPQTWRTNVSATPFERTEAWPNRTRDKAQADVKFQEN